MLFRMRPYAHPYKMAAHLIVSDEDAADFLQSQFSNDLRSLCVGESTYGLWLDVKGKIVADSWVLREGGGQFRIFSEHGAGVSIKEKLEHHIIADDVQLETSDEMEALAIIGGELRSPPVESDGSLFCLQGRRSKMPSLELIFPDVASRVKWLGRHDCEIVSDKWIQEERMEAGISSVGREVMPGDLPGEAGLVEEAVSLGKGCFLGQEVVARMYNVGRPQRRLYLLSGSGEAPALPSPISNAEGKSLGELRSVLTTDSSWKGVAMLKSRFVEQGMRLPVGGGLAGIQGDYSREGWNGFD